MVGASGSGVTWVDSGLGVGDGVEAGSEVVWCSSMAFAMVSTFATSSLREEVAVLMASAMEDFSSSVVASANFWLRVSISALMDLILVSVSDFSERSEERSVEG